MGRHGKFQSHGSLWYEWVRSDHWQDAWVIGIDPLGSLLLREWLVVPVDLVRSVRGPELPRILGKDLVVSEVLDVSGVDVLPEQDAVKSAGLTGLGVYGNGS